jgi:hypothetical protein
VWANRKFVGKNQEEVAQYILVDRSTINEELDDLIVNHTEDSGIPEVRQFSVDNAIFEEPEHSICSASIVTIAEVDPMGACLLSLLSKLRIRESIQIT